MKQSFTRQPLFGPITDMEEGPDVFAPERTEMDEIARILAILGAAPAPIATWSYSPDNEAIDTFAGGGCSYSLTETSPVAPIVAVAVSQEEVQPLVAFFLETEPGRRQDLRIPLDRLIRSRTRRSPVDRAIELGIALESFLLHNDENPGEHTYKIAVRGARYLGGDQSELEASRLLLRRCYELRSQGVHSGHLNETAKLGDEGKVASDQIIARGGDLLGRMLRKAIERKSIPDWKQFDLGL